VAHPNPWFSNTTPRRVRLAQGTDAMYHKDPKKAGEQDTSIKFGGRTIVMTVVVNTDEDARASASASTTQRGAQSCVWR